MNISALQSRNFRLYLSGNLFALNALWMLRVAVAWIAWDVTGQAGFVGVVAFLYFAPAMVAGPVFGVIADRVNVRSAALVTQIIMLVLVLLLLTLHLGDMLGPGPILAYSLAAGATMSAYSPLRMSMGPRLVAREDVSSVVNVVAINFNLARLTGPAIGGALIAGLGIGPTLVIIALCYLPFLLVLPRLEVRARRNAAVAPPPFLTALAGGLRHVRRDPVITEAMAVTAIGSFFLRGVLEILPVLADGVYARGAGGLGMLTSAAGAGALLAGTAILLGRRVGEGRAPARVYAAACLGFAALAVLALAKLWPLALGLVAVMAFCGTTIGVLCQSAVQASIDDDLRGRVMSLWGMVAMGTSALGAAGLGLLIDAMGPAPALFSAALTGGLTLALLWVRRGANR